MPPEYALKYPVRAARGFVPSYLYPASILPQQSFGDKPVENKSWIILGLLKATEVVIYYI